jgi:hypothetical protein
MTWFKFDPVEEHSRCTQCGGWKATRHPALKVKKVVKVEKKEKPKMKCFVFEITKTEVITKQHKVIATDEVKARITAEKGVVNGKYIVGKLLSVEELECKK